MLALTKKSGYGLIAMAHLARLEGGDLASAREIAETYDISTSLLMNALKASRSPESMFLPTRIKPSHLKPTPKKASSRANTSFG